MWIMNVKACHLPNEQLCLYLIHIFGSIKQASEEQILSQQPQYNVSGTE